MVSAEEDEQSSVKKPDWIVGLYNEGVGRHYCGDSNGVDC